MSIEGKLFLNTRALIQASELSRLLESKGANVIEFPTLEITKSELSNEDKAKLSQITVNDLIVFTSVNGVKIGAEFLKDLNVTASVVAIGKATAEAAENRGLKVVFISKDANSKSLGRELVEFISENKLQLKGDRKIFLLRGDVASEELPRILASSKETVIHVTVYF